MGSMVKTGGASIDNALARVVHGSGLDQPGLDPPVSGGGRRNPDSIRWKIGQVGFG